MAGTMGLYRSMLKVFGKCQMMSDCYFMVYIGILSIQDYKVGTVCKLPSYVRTYVVDHESFDFLIFGSLVKM